MQKLVLKLVTKQVGCAACNDAVEDDCRDLCQT